MGTQAKELAHAEGYNTNAKGKASHAEGFGTIATTPYSHAEGRYNVEDEHGRYVHITGWGNNDSDRKNIYTLDTSGNAWFKGGIILTTPDGTKKYKITIDNSGKLITTLFTNY